MQLQYSFVISYNIHALLDLEFWDTVLSCSLGNSHIIEYLIVQGYNLNYNQVNGRWIKAWTATEATQQLVTT